MVYGILEEPFQSLEAINISSLHTGLQRVQLLKPEVPTPAVPADTRTMEIRAPDVLIPSEETTYWCYITELPQGFPRHHIVMVGGVRPALPRGQAPAVPSLEGRVLLSRPPSAWAWGLGFTSGGSSHPLVPCHRHPTPPWASECPGSLREQ